MAINLLLYAIKSLLKKSTKIVLSPFFIPSFVGAVFRFCFSHFYSACSFPFPFCLVMDTRSSTGCFLTTEHTSELLQSKRGQAKSHQYRGCAVSTYIGTICFNCLLDTFHMFAVTCVKWREIKQILAARVYGSLRSQEMTGYFRFSQRYWWRHVLWEITPCILVMYMPPFSWSKQFKKNAVINCSDPENGDDKFHLPGVIFQRA